MTSDLQARIEVMFTRDKLFATGFVIVLWAVVFFVLLAVRPFMPAGGIEIVCWIAAGVLVLFNTASITAMIRHYANDKQHIYSVDIRHLDAGR